MELQHIDNVGTLLREIWRHEPGLLREVFKFLFIPLHEDQGNERYITALPQIGTTKIKSISFRDSCYLQSLIISNTVTVLEHSCFDVCSDLEYVHIGKSVTHIGIEAFEHCSSLRRVHLPDSLESIGEMGFQNCWSLRAITLPESLVNIGEDAFYQCKALQSVTIPDSVTSIGKGAFRRCKKLNQASIPKHLEKTVRELEVFPKHTKIIVR